MLRKKRNILIVVISILLVWSIFYAAVDFFVIPRYVIPALYEYSSNNLESGVKITFSDVSFSPIRGFLIHDLNITGPIPLNNKNEILTVKTLDTDIALLPLLFNKVVFKKLKMQGADFNIGRNAEGEWNIAPLLNQDLEDSISNHEIYIKEFAIIDGWIDYSDCHNNNNTLERRFENVRLSLKHKSGKKYKIVLSGGSADRSDEAIELSMTYDFKKGQAKGRAKLNSTHVTEYWDYYLDDILKPWHLKAVDVTVKTNFSYRDGVLLLDGEYSVDDGIFSYGDLNIKCDMVVEHHIKLAKSGMQQKDIVKIKAHIKDARLAGGKNLFFKDGVCRATMTKDLILIEDLTGFVGKAPVSMSGVFSLEKSQLDMHGKISSVDNKIYMKIFPDNKAKMLWKGKFFDSFFEFNANVYDLKDLAFKMYAKCNMDFKDISRLLKNVDKDFATGKLSFSGNLQGEADEFDSYKGRGKLSVKELSVTGTDPLSFDFNTVIKEGVLNGNIPRVKFYKGGLDGNVKLSVQRWGAELHLEEADLKEFSKVELQTEHMKGVLSTGITAVGDWGDLDSVKGGGYILLKDCDIRKEPILETAQEGIAGAVKDFEMPGFTEVTGNFDIADRRFMSKGILCDSPGMVISISGKYSFDQEVDLTVGVKFLGGGFMKFARSIFIIPTDLLTSIIRVKITGRLPDKIEQHTEVHPFHILADIFPTRKDAAPEKYSLDKFWEQTG